MCPSASTIPVPRHPALQSPALRCFCLLLLGLLLLTRLNAYADLVTDWNELLVEALRTENAAPTGGSRIAAIVHGAIYDAVNSIYRDHEPYRFDVPPAMPGASPEAAALAAAYGTLTILCPSTRARFNDAYTNALHTLPAGPERNEGLRVGETVARLMLEWRAADGSSTQVPYIPSQAPGAWQRTPPDFRPPLDPQWGFVKPFVIPSVLNFPVPPPPGLGSPGYTAGYEFTRSVGALNSSTRTADQTAIGLFWAYDRTQLGPVTILHNRLLQAIARQQGNTLEQNARLFALVNLACADAGITCWKAKYQYNFWRPITAIHAADSDGNADTEADTAWEPLGCPGAGIQQDFTPPFPSYPSGHAFGTAVFQILKRFYGTDQIAFDLQSEELPGQPRHYETFSQAEEENVLARVYLGVHWIFDQRAGQRMGRQVGDFVFYSALRPLPSTPTLELPMRLPDGSVAVHLSAPTEQLWRVRISDDLAAWRDLLTGNGSRTFLDPPSSPTARFYYVLPEE